MTLITLRATRRKAAADAKKAEELAKASEIENVDAAVKIWRELATTMSERQAKLSAQVEELSVEVRRLKNATNKVVRLLDRITPDNMSEMIEVIKNEIEREQNDIKNPRVLPLVDGVSGEDAGNERAVENG